MWMSLGGLFGAGCPDSVYGSSGSAPGGVYDHFCPTQNEDGSPNTDPEIGAWFDTTYPPANTPIMDRDGVTILDYLEANDARVVWDSAYSEYYASSLNGLPPNECAEPDAFGEYPPPCSNDEGWALLFWNDTPAAYPPPEIRDSATGEFGIFYCPDTYDVYGGGGVLTQIPQLVFRTLDPSEGSPFEPTDYWYTCYYCPSGYTYDPITEQCVEDVECPPGECYSVPAEGCVDCSELPDCYEERECSWDMETGAYDCIAVEDMCPPGQVYNLGICACEDAETCSGAGPWYTELRVKARANRSDLYFATGDREIRAAFVGPQPQQGPVALPAGVWTALDPPCAALGLVVEMNGSVNLRVKGASDDLGVRLTPPKNVPNIPLIIPLAEDAAVGIYNPESYAQSVRVRWLMGTTLEEDAPI